MSTKMCGIGALFHQKNLRKSSSGGSSSSSALGNDWLQRTSSSSWENFSHTSSGSSSELEFSGEIAPEDVPEGSLALYVGSSEGGPRRRFVVGTGLVNNPLFKPLLDKAAEEYGYDQAGALTIPCDALIFEHVMWLLDNNDPASAHLEISQLLR